MTAVLICLVVLLLVALAASMWMTTTYRSLWMTETEKRRAAERCAR